ncbi:30S ribosomal protein S17 [Candidatus Saccharibacteria bacterium RIFCSPHIGHO2_12_FULL_49_19]|nr:MAG: 30S ribosomal protein S17 [Candidatus Saccharibacteria bacterium RIFCSPHIGHO2_01_FULL_49_21]OGL37790.1 MAG: 30S ribosomal protein S17 [Candidatus Saccharibacteria bacterium RIFCSPHIGHO2_12_FULL_49_19]OGL38581.1 MAG: 30S ribosomal protein S17 [Candidatus Saccharibacteria bacterium RIFCSPLOWO2_01_FULL_49_22]
MGRSITGVVVSDRGDKTIVISVTTKKTHPIYKKQYTVKDKFMAHDESNSAKVGDRVIIAETRPLSAKKSFRLVKIVERGGIKFVEEDATADIAELKTEEEQK